MVAVFNTIVSRLDDATYNYHDSLQACLIEGIDHIRILGVGLELACNGG